MATASQDALPGDVLYPLKRGIEQAQAGLGTSPAARGERLLELHRAQCWTVKPALARR